MISQMRDQFFTLLVGIGFASPPHNHYRGRGKNRYGGAASDKSAPYNANASNLQLVTAVIAAGLCVAPRHLRVRTSTCAIVVNAEWRWCLVATALRLQVPECHHRQARWA